MAINYTATNSKEFKALEDRMEMLMRHFLIGGTSIRVSPSLADSVEVQGITQIVYQHHNDQGLNEPKDQKERARVISANRDHVWIGIASAEKYYKYLLHMVEKD